LIHALKLKNIQINRKVLADLAASQPSIFKRIVRSAIG
jgi:ribosomal protein L20